jgi:drug/metabolite transporter (DMT)-like permease
MAGMFIAVKGVSRDIPLGEIVFFRSFFAIIPLVIFLWVWREFPGGLATNRPSAHFIRASFGAFALFGFFAAIERLNLAEAVLIAQVSPIVIAIVAVVFLPERMSHWRIGALALGVAGVVVLVWSGLSSKLRAAMVCGLPGISSASGLHSSLLWPSSWCAA